jgi:hypothetical protein
VRIDFDSALADANAYHVGNQANHATSGVLLQKTAKLLALLL